MHCNFFIVLPIWLEICRYNFLFCKTRCARPKKARFQSFCEPDWHRARNLWKSVNDEELLWKCFIINDYQGSKCISGLMPSTLLTLYKENKFSIKNFFGKCDQICSFLRNTSHLLKESIKKNFLFCAMSVSI